MKHKAAVTGILAVVAMLSVAGAAGAVAQTTADDGSTVAGGENLTVETEWADPYGETRAALGGNVTSLGDADTAYAWFEYREAGADGWSVLQSRTLNSSGRFYAKTTALAPNTTYEYRAAATDRNQSSVARGDVKTFETFHEPPAVSTGSAVAGDDSATLNATATDLGGAAGANVSFAYRESGADAWNRTDADRVASTGTVAVDVDGLSPETTYEYYAVIEADDGQIASGESRNVTTDASLRAETRKPSGVDETVATLHGDYEGGNDYVEFGFEYRERGASDWRRVDADWGSYGFDATVTGLEPGADYEYRAVVSAPSHGNATGDVVGFTTDSRPSVRTGDASAVGETTATVDAELTDVGGAFSATVAVEYREAGADAWQSTDAASRSAPGAVAFDLGGLADGTEYEYRAVATASDGDAATGAVRTFVTRTAERPPAVDGLRVSEDSPPNPHAELSVDWAVSDADGDLDATTVTVRDDRGRVVERWTSDGYGGADSGSEYAKLKHGAGERYTVAVTVTDHAGHTTTERTSVWT